MPEGFDLRKARIFLYYLNRASKEKNAAKEAEMVSVSSRIKSLANRLDNFIRSQEDKRFKALDRKEIKSELKKDLAKVKRLLIQAKKEGTDPERLFSLVERAGRLKDKIEKI